MNNPYSQVKRNIIITSILLILVGLTYAGFSVYSIVSTEQFIAATPKAEAKVVNISKKRNREGGYRTRVYVTYSINENEYAYIYVANAPSSIKKDEIILIHYDPENPRRIAAAEQSYTYRLMGTLIGLMMAGLGVRRAIRSKIINRRKL